VLQWQLSLATEDWAQLVHQRRRQMVATLLLVHSSLWAVVAAEALTTPLVVMAAQQGAVQQTVTVPVKAQLQQLLPTKATMAVQKTLADLVAVAEAARVAQVQMVVTTSAVTVVLVAQSPSRELL
jgi:hypothetical protein